MNISKLLSKQYRYIIYKFYFFSPREVYIKHFEAESSSNALPIIAIILRIIH